ncbi:MAG: CRISP-associated protein Cas1 [Candidatus Sumerlaeota bacterium]|nr:CRISP-associated protein Cas1 [Candidatus Sumerlaeota bacterium]
MENGCLCVEPPGARPVRIPPEHAAEILVYGSWSLTSPVLGLAAEHAIPISFFSFTGEWTGRLDTGEAAGSHDGEMSDAYAFDTLRAQWRLAAGEESALAFARRFVAGKLHNSRTVLAVARCRSRAAGEDRAALAETAAILRRATHQLEGTASFDALRGVEGSAARAHFGALARCILPEARAEFPFAGRNRRPPRDPFNALLSYLYALLFHDCVNALRAEGLETRLGFLHAPHRGRHALALDLMEELRPLVADRLALALVNRRQLRAAHFTADPVTGAVLLGADGRRVLFQARAARQNETILPPGTVRTPIAWRAVPRHQARLLAAALRAGDPALYAPFTPRL